MPFQLYSWGANSHGQLGLGFTSELCALPARVPLDDLPAVDFCEQITEITGGGGHSLFLTKRGSVYSCGWNNRGQLGLGTDSESVNTITQIPDDAFGSVSVRHLRTGWDSSAALGSEGEILMWGSNAFQLLGVSSGHLRSTNTPMRLSLPGGESCLDLQFGLRNTVFLTPTNMYVIGSAKLPKRLKEQWPEAVHQQQHNGIDYWRFDRSICGMAVGQNHVVFVEAASANSVLSFGDDRYAQASAKPIQLPVEGTEIRNLQSGWTHSGLLTNDGSVYLWGRNNYGQLGQDPKISGTLVHAPLQLRMPSDDAVVEDLSLGAEHGMCVTRSKSVYTWGWNEHGNCGNGNEEDVISPTRVEVSGPCVKAAAGSGFCYTIIDEDSQTNNQNN